MTTKEECDKEFKEVLGEDYPYTLNNIKIEDIEAYLNATGKTDQEKTVIFKRIIGGKRCMSICDNNLSDAACRHKKRFYFGLAQVTGFDPTKVRHHLIYNNSNNVDVDLRHVMLEFNEAIEENEELFYENLTKLDELYKLGNKNIDEINDLEDFVIENYVYFYLKNQTEKKNQSNPDNNKSILSNFKHENVDLTEDFNIIILDDAEKFETINSNILESLKIIYNDLIPNNSIIFIPKPDDLKIDYEKDFLWYITPDKQAPPLSSYYGIEYGSLKFKSIKTKKTTMQNRLRSVFSPRRRSASLTLGRGKKKLFKKNTSRKSLSQKNFLKKSLIKKLKKNTSRKSVIKKLKKNTSRKSVRRKK